MEHQRDYRGIILRVDDYKENDKVQFTLSTPLPFINTNKDFETPELAFQYAEELMAQEFMKIINDIYSKPYAEAKVE